MIGAIVGAAVGVASSIFGGIKKRKAAKRLREQVERQRRENKAWYDRRINEDATQRAGAVRAINKAEEIFRNRNKAAQGTQAIMGGTEEGVAATKAANAQAMADVTGKIAAEGDARKDAIEQQYMQTDSELQNQIGGIDMQKQQAMSQAVSGVGNAVGGLISSLDSNGEDGDKEDKKEDKAL